MDVYDELVRRMLEDTKNKKNYEQYIIKDITFKEWVIGFIDDHLLFYNKEK